MQFQSLLVEEKDRGERLDSFLSKKLGISRSNAQTLIENGNVRLNHKSPKKSGAVLATNDFVHYRKEIKPSQLEAQDIPLNILFEDSELLVINKAPGIVVHPNETGHYSGTIANAILAHCKELVSKGYRPGIVHRLDKDTSGALLIAKTEASLQELSKLFHDRKVHKTYWALVSGKPKTEEGSIDAPIQRDTKSRQRMAIHAQGRHALTSFKILEVYVGATLLEVKIETGRTHQIRLHLASIGHPVLGDPVYGDNKINKTFASKYDLKRQFLHAKSIEFEGRHFEAPLAPDLKTVLDQLKKH